MTEPASTNISTVLNLSNEEKIRQISSDDSGLGEIQNSEDEQTDSEVVILDDSDMEYSEDDLLDIINGITGSGDETGNDQTDTGSKKPDSADIISTDSPEGQTTDKNDAIEPRNETEDDSKIHENKKTNLLNNLNDKFDDIDRMLDKFLYEDKIKSTYAVPKSTNQTSRRHNRKMKYEKLICGVQCYSVIPRVPTPTIESSSVDTIKPLLYFDNTRLAITKSDERQRRRNAAQQAASNIDDQIDSDEEIFNDIYADINDFEEISSDPEDSANIDIYSSSDDDDFDFETEDVNCSLDKSRGFDSNLSLEIASSLEGEHSGMNEDFDDHEFLHDVTYGVHNSVQSQSQESNIFIADEEIKKCSKSASCGELSETSEEGEVGNEAENTNGVGNTVELETQLETKSNEVEEVESEDDIEDEIIEENLISEKSDSSKEKRYQRQPIRIEYPAVNQKTERRISKTSVDSASTEMDLNRISFVEDHVPKLYSEITESSDCFALIPEDDDEEPVQVKRKKSKKFRSIRKFFGFLFSCTKA